MYSLSRCLYLLQSLLITLFGDKNSCLEIRVMCCFSKPVEEGVGRHGFAALFTSPRRPASPAALPVPPASPPGCWSQASWEPPPGAQHPTLCSDMVEGTQAQQHPWGARGWGAGGGCPAQPGRTPWVGFGADRAPSGFADRVSVTRCQHMWHCGDVPAAP